MIVKSAVLIEIEDKHHAVPLRAILQGIVDQRKKAFRHQQIAPGMVVVRGPHVLGPVGVVGVDEDDIGKLAPTSVSPKLLDGIGDVVISTACEEAGDRRLVVVIARRKAGLAHAVEDRRRNDDWPALLLFIFGEVAPALVELCRTGDLKEAVLPGRTPCSPWPER